MSENPFKKMQKDWKEGFSKFQTKVESDFERIKGKIGDPDQKEHKMNEFLEKSKQTMEKWQTDWKETHEKNLQKIKNNNHKIKEFFAKQQKNMEENFNSMKTSIETNIQEDKEYNEELKQAFKNNWTEFVEGQKEVQGRYMKMQNRLWWKGYLNFLSAMLVIVALIVFVIFILKHFGILP